MKEKSKKLAVLLKSVSFALPDLPEISAYLDTGYSKDETIKMLKTMYKDKNVAYERFGLYLFAWIDKEAEDKYPDGIHDGEVKFSHNWNNKLNCDCWTTIRLANDRKYKIGGLYRIYWPGENTTNESP